MRTAALFVALLAAPLFADNPPQATPSQVTLPLGEYQVLRDANQRPSATVVDTIRLGGTFRARDLTITFSGRSVGQRPEARVIDGTHDVTISGCSGAGLVIRAAKGAFSVIPNAETFDIKCSLHLSGSDRLEMHSASNVLAVESNVADGELITGDEDDNGGRQYSLVRQVASTGERLAATATGRYQITLLPDATRFRYAIDVHNPNRSTSSLVLDLVSNEHLQQIDSVAPYEVEGTRYTFAIPPGDSTIAMTGELRGTAFRAPVAASLQYLLLESHPLIRPSVQTPAKRVSVAETGITPQYRGALAFETGTQQIAWQVTRLEALRTTSYAANSATHTFFVPLDGPVLGETEFELRNEGAADLVLPAKPEPTFVSLGNEPVLMTKNREGRLTVPLSTGVQNVLVQHRQTFNERLGFGYGRIVVPQLDVPASRTFVRMTYPGEWIPLYESFATRSVLWTPDPAMVLLFIALALWVERLLAWLAYPTAKRFVVALVAGLAGTIVFTFMLLLIFACAALTIAWILTLPMKKRVAAAVGIVAAGFIVFLIIGVSNVGMTKYEAENAVTSTEVVARNVDEPKAGAEQPIAYQGLPAKFELPSGSRYTSFSQELLRADREQAVRVFAVSMSIVKWIGALIAIAVLFVLSRDRRALVESFRARTQVAPQPEAVTV